MQYDEQNLPLACAECDPPEPSGSLASRVTTMASAAAGAALGMPFDSSGSLHAAWVEVSQRIAALRK